ncbi:MAG: hypothetical protein C0507_12570 [Cyanobacteria bacterium PR.3.49]|nr:hypothetical protein [Cyanobacteria bacterium PR.3.49]
MPSAYRSQLQTRFDQLKSKGKQALTAIERQELVSVFEQLECLRISDNFDLPYGVKILKAKFENKCRGCAKRIKIGHWMKYVVLTKGCYCLSCSPGQTSSIKTRRVSLPKLDEHH